MERTVEKWREREAEAWSKRGGEREMKCKEWQKCEKTGEE